MIASTDRPRQSPEMMRRRARSAPLRRAYPSSTSQKVAEGPDEHRAQTQTHKIDHQHVDSEGRRTGPRVHDILQNRVRGREAHCVEKRLEGEQAERERRRIRQDCDDVDRRRNKIDQGHLD